MPVPEGVSRVMTPDGPGRISRVFRSKGEKYAIVSVDAGGVRLVNEYPMSALTEFAPSEVPIEITDEEARALQIVLSSLGATDIRRFVSDGTLDDVAGVLRKLNVSLGPPPRPVQVRRVR